MSDLIDGSIHDILTLGIAATYGWINARRFPNRRPERFVSFFSYGLSLYPLFLLTITAFSSKALVALSASNKVLITVGGVIALVATLRRTFEDAPVPQQVGKPPQS